MKDILDKFFTNIANDLKDESFKVEFWDKETKKYGQGPVSFKVIIKTLKTAKRIFHEKSLGFGEEYMNGNIVIEGDLQTLLKISSTKTYMQKIPDFKTIAKIILSYITYQNTSKKSKSNIQSHYDQGVEFFKLWLDKSLTYSCAYFEKDNNTLEEAQKNKYEHLCRKLLLKPGERLIDIGCGFGGMLIYAARNYGIKGEGYTLSEDQYNEALKRIKKEDLEDKIKIHLKDYRLAEGKFDKFVSIGMFEHVGKQYYNEFFRKVKLLLKPGGLGVLHTIGNDKDQPTDPWLRKYIFPGGEFPAVQNIIDTMSRHNLYFIDIENLRIHYHKTLEEWIKRFEANRDKIRGMYGEEFVRMWRLYLNGSSFAFKSGQIFLYQIVFTNGINNDIPITRKHIYDR